MNIFGWNKQFTDEKPKEEEAEMEIIEEDDLAEGPKNLPAVKEIKQEIAARKPSSEVVVRPAKRDLVEYRPRTIMIGKEPVRIDAKTLIRGIKQITQTIGEYKNSETAYAKFVIPGLRKVRSDMVSELEHHFGIHWEIDERSGQSVFYK